MGCYLALTNTSTNELVVEAIFQHPLGAELMVVVKLKADIVDPEGNRQDKLITAALTDEGMEYMASHFLPRRLPCEREGQT